VVALWSHPASLLRSGRGDRSSPGIGSRAKEEDHSGPENLIAGESIGTVAAETASRHTSRRCQKLAITIAESALTLAKATTPANASTPPPRVRCDHTATTPTHRDQPSHQQERPRHRLPATSARRRATTMRPHSLSRATASIADSDHRLINTRHGEAPVTWRFSQIIGAITQPSGRQDLNLRPLDPQCARPLICKNRPTVDIAACYAASRPVARGCTKWPRSRFAPPTLLSPAAAASTLLEEAALVRPDPSRPRP
jgi:hypothetical protein